MAETIDPQAAIADYLAAFRGAGYEPLFRMAYERGWVRFYDTNGWPQRPVRVRVLMAMTDRIRARSALAKATSGEEG